MAKQSSSKESQSPFPSLDQPNTAQTDNLAGKKMPELQTPSESSIQATKREMASEDPDEKISPNDTKGGKADEVEKEDKIWNTSLSVDPDSRQLQ